MIKFENLSKTFQNGTVGLRNVSGSFADTGIHLIMGHSGSGKTTLLQILALLQTFDGGDLCIDDLNIANLREKQKLEFRRDHFGFVFQSFFLQEQLTALENVMLPMLAQNCMSLDAMMERGEILLKQVQLENRTRHYPRELSGGEQQRVAIARALANDPKYIFADEPTGNLDEESENHILEIFQMLSATHSIIIVSHNPITEKYANAFFDMKDGVLSRRMS